MLVQCGLGRQAQEKDKLTTEPSSSGCKANVGRRKAILRCRCIDFLTAVYTSSKNGIEAP